MAIAGLSLDTRSDALIFVSVTFAGMALGLLAVCLLVANPGLVGPAIGALELVYLVHVLISSNSSLVTVAIVSVSGLLAGELAQWSLDSRYGGDVHWTVHLGRVRAIAGLTALSAAVVGIVSLSALAPVVEGGWTVVLAVASSVGIVALVSLAAGRGAGADTGEFGAQSG